MSCTRGSVAGEGGGGVVHRGRRCSDDQGRQIGLIFNKMKKLVTGSIKEVCNVTAAKFVIGPTKTRKASDASPAARSKPMSDLIFGQIVQSIMPVEGCVPVQR